MRSRSSSSPPERLLPVGKVTGHRGREGELTVKVSGGDAAPWTEPKRFWLEGSDGRGGRFHEVETSRAYRNRLVLKLRGIDEAGGAAALRGARVLAEPDEAARLPEGTYYVSRLVGLTVYDEKGTELGRVHDLMPSGGTDVLCVWPGPGSKPGRDEREILIPMAKEFLLEIDEENGWMRVRLPDGLLELNQDPS